MPIQWDDQHQTQRRANRWQLRRTPRGGKIEAYAVSDSPVGVWTHYYGGKTMPCSGTDCKACADKQSPRKHWYLAAIEAKTGEKFLLELTDRGADSIIEYHDKTGHLRGRFIRTFRLNSRPNGPVESQVGDQAAEHIKIPRAPDVRECLIIIWALDGAKANKDDAAAKNADDRNEAATRISNGISPDEDDQLPRDEHTGGHRSTDDVHEQQKEASDFPESATIEPALTRTSLPTTTNGDGRGQLVGNARRRKK